MAASEFVMEINFHQNPSQEACVAGPKNRSAIDPTVVVNFLKLGLVADIVPANSRANYTGYNGDPVNQNLARL